MRHCPCATVGQPEDPLWDISCPIGARLTSLTNHIEDIELVVRRRDGRIVDANSRAAEAYGASIGRLRAMRLQDLAGGEVPTGDLEGPDEVVETEHRRLDGTTFPVQISAHSFSADGEAYRHCLVRDVTRRREAEAERQFLSTLVLQMAEGVAVLDEQGTIRWWSARAAALTGCEVRRAVGQPIAGLLRRLDDAPITHPNDLVGAACLVRPSAFLQVDVILEASVTVLPASVCLGMPAQFLVVLRDDTAKHQATRALADMQHAFDVSQRRCHEAQEVAAVGVWEVSAVDGSVFWSPELCAALGRPLDQPAPRLRAFMAQSVHPDDRAPCLSAFRSLHEGHSRGVRLRVVRHDGRAIWLHLRGGPIHDAQGHVLHWRGIALDVTDWQEATLQLEEHERQLADAERVGGLGHWQWHFRRGTCHWSANLYRLLGRAPDEGPLDLLQMAALVVPDDRPLLESLAAQVQRGESGTISLRPAARPGVTLEVRAEPVRSSSGRLRGARGILVDVSEHMARERRLAEARDAALAAATARATFLATMSHEIRTPMHGVLGMLQLLEGTRLDPDQRACLATAIGSGEALLALLNDGLDLSKLDAGKLAPHLARFHLAGVLTECVDLVADRGTGRHVPVTVDIAPDVAEWVTGDVTRFRQVLSNLLSNAVKFTHDGHVSVRASVDGELVRLEVEDTGIGIDPAHQERLFTPFSQAHTGIAAQYGGTGLGLAIARQLVTMMGGEIGVTSAPGQGSRFWFTARLPEAAQPQPAVVATTASAADAMKVRGARVLVVDDNAVNRRVAERMLLQLGHVPTMASDGNEALALLSALTFDLVLMDCQMPDLDGYETTRRLRAAGRVALPVVAVTASVMAEDRDRCLAAGMNDFMGKPFSARTLDDVVTRHVRAATS